MGDEKSSAEQGNDRTKSSRPDTQLVWPGRAVTPNRHGAIARQLSSYSHYKMWVDRMRNAWRKEDEDAAPETPPII